MKSRQKKHLSDLVKRSPIVAFSIEDEFVKGERVTEEEVSRIQQHVRYDLEDADSTSFKQQKEQLVSNLYLYVNNYLNCGGYQWVYLLAPVEKGVYKVVEKQKKSEWQERYWEKEDPHFERDWSYLGEDTDDLFDYVMARFMKYQSKRGKKS